MAIECYFNTCPYHSSNEIGQRNFEPLCYHKECKATETELYKYEKLRNIYLNVLKENNDTYEKFLEDQKRIWFGKLWWWRFNKFIRSIFGQQK